MSYSQTDILNDIIQNRQSIFPKQYIQKSIPKEIINQILLNADRAPSHKLTEPWRFKILRGQSKSDLGNFLADKYKEITPSPVFLQKKYDSFSLKTSQSDCVIAIVLHKDTLNRLPEWEEVAAVAMSVQNMWLTCSAYGIGCYWSSPGLIKYCHDFFKLSENEKCLGFFYMGYYEGKSNLSPRKDLSSKVEWVG